MNHQPLLYEEDNHLAILTLNRPNVMNSINFELLNDLKNKIEKLRYNSNIRVVIITGTGKKSFCSGADLKERITLRPIKVKEYILTIRNLFTDIEHLNKPVISGINGIALGGGTELALASDIRIISENALLGLTETKLAIIPGAGGTQRLTRLIGIGRAKELIFTGKKINAKKSLDFGLVNKISKTDCLMKDCIEIASEICESGPIAIEQAKYAINYGSQTDLNTGLAIESNAYWICIPTKDRLEGLTAFKEKRKPIYKGK